MLGYVRSINAGLNYLIGDASSLARVEDSNALEDAALEAHTATGGAQHLVGDEDEGFIVAVPNGRYAVHLAEIEVCPGDNDACLVYIVPSP